MIKIILCGYREWAKKIFESIKLYDTVEIIDVINSQDEYKQKENKFPSEIDIIIFIGWSWIIPKSTTDKFLCLGIHPSNLPYYRGGSPLQHQIINGIERTKVTLMTLSSGKLDAGEIWGQTDLDLTGKNMTEVFTNLTTSSIILLHTFFDKYPNVFPQEQNISMGSYYKRRTPKQSQLTWDQMQKLNLKELYNFIRSLTDPYPNAYIEDEYGNKLVFKQVEYISKD